MILVLLAPPAGGKGTQAARLSERYGVEALSSGNLLRAAVDDKTDWGARIEPLLKAGRLVPDDLVTALLREEVQRCIQRKADSILFDGYPRNLRQAELLDAMLGELGLNLDVVLRLDVSDEEVVRRVSGRRICQNCGATFHITFSPPVDGDRCDRCGGQVRQRTDDSEDTMRRRLALYHNTTEPLIDFYRDRGLLMEIPANDDPERIFERIVEAIESRSPRPA